MGRVTIMHDTTERKAKRDYNAMIVMLWVISAIFFGLAGGFLFNSFAWGFRIGFLFLLIFAFEDLSKWKSLKRVLTIPIILAYFLTGVLMTIVAIFEGVFDILYIPLGLFIGMIIYWRKHRFWLKSLFKRSTKSKHKSKKKTSKKNKSSKKRGIISKNNYKYYSCKSVPQSIMKKHNTRIKKLKSQHKRIGKDQYYFDKARRYIIRYENKQLKFFTRQRTKYKKK